MATLIPLLDISEKSLLSVPRLPQLRLTTKEERGALHRLKLTWGRKAEQKEFESLVLARLKLIEDLRTPRMQSKPTRSIEKLRRRAGMADRFARRLQEPILDALSLSIPVLVTPPIREIQFYAEQLRTCADSIAAHSPNRRLRHTSRPETQAVIRLIEVVKQMTGRRHLASLCVLLRTACHEVGVNESRLNSLMTDHAKRRGIFARAKQSLADR